MDDRREHYECSHRVDARTLVLHRRAKCHRMDCLWDGATYWGEFSTVRSTQQSSARIRQTWLEQSGSIVSLARFMRERPRKYCAPSLPAPAVRWAWRCASE